MENAISIDPSDGMARLSLGEVTITADNFENLNLSMTTLTPS